jgi:hypothetical protein
MLDVSGDALDHLLAHGDTAHLAHPFDTTQAGYPNQLLAFRKAPQLGFWF